MQKAIAWAIAHKAQILAGVVAFDHALAAIPGVKANSTYQFFSGLIGKAKNAVLGA